ncbi:MAG: LamG-like jellyroll fold domain-containing protein, partial [Candidatus Methylacidiphilales bacterium]
MRHVFLLALLSVASVFGIALAGSYEKDGLDDAWKASRSMATNVVAPEALIGWWQLNETNGLSAADRSASALPLTLTAPDGALVPPGASAEGGTVWRPGLLDNGAALQGAYYFVAQVPGVYGLEAAAGFTFSAWVKTEAVAASSNDFQVIARWRDASGYGWELDTAANGQLRARFDAAGGANQVVQAAVVEGLVKDGAWHQAAVSYLPSTGEAKIYLDGKLEGTKLIVGSFGPAAAEFRIGDKGFGSAWKGSVDEVRLYKKVLSATEVASLPVTYSDLDGDGRNTLQEMLAGSNPGLRDSDNDGIPDGAEAVLGLNATNAADASLVSASGLTRLQEYRLGMDAANGSAGGAVAPTRLTGYWPFELNSTNVSAVIGNPNYVLDHSASGLPGALRGVPSANRAQVFGPGKVGSALVLDGNGQYVEVNPSSTAVLSDYTVSAWVKTSDTAGSNAIFQWMDANGLGFELGVTNMGAARARIDTSAATQGQVNQVVQNWSGSAKLIGDGQWHFVALTYVSGSRTAFLYVDGVLESTRQIAGTHGVTAQSIKIGSGWNASWKGSLDEVRLWDVVLTSDQIAALHQPSLAGSGTGTSGGGTTAPSTTTTPATTAGGSIPASSGSTNAAPNAVPAEAPVGDRLAAVIKHRPQINGKLDGSVQQLLAEDVTLNSGAIITGDLLVPGVPQLTQNGSASQMSFGGIKTGTGAATPTNHRLTLNSNSTLRYLATRIDAVTLPVAEVPKNPTGNRSVNLNGPNDPVGDWATLRDLNCNGNNGTLTVPAGAYGNFNAGGNWVLKLGVAGATTPALYEFQSINLNSTATFQIVGPVEIRLKNSFNNNGILGDPAHPENLVFKISNGGVNLNSGSKIYGQVIAPSGTVNINGNTLLSGTVRADQLTINSGGELRYTTTSAPPVPVVVTVSLTAPAADALLQAPALVQLAATATASSGTIAKVEFYAKQLTGSGEGNIVRLGEDTSAPYTYSWSNV